jgi:hypothetical protein
MKNCDDCNANMFYKEALLDALNIKTTIHLRCSKCFESAEFTLSDQFVNIFKIGKIEFTCKICMGKHRKDGKVHHFIKVK